MRNFIKILFIFFSFKHKFPFSSFNSFVKSKNYKFPFERIYIFLHLFPKYSAKELDLLMHQRFQHAKSLKQNKGLIY